MTARTRAFVYDNKGRFVIQETNVLGHVQSATFDVKTGWRLTQTDANGLTTSFQYDALGRISETTRPDQTVHHVRYSWNRSPAFANAVYYISETETGRPTSTTYFDVLGRTIFTYTAGRGYNDVVYNALGQLSKTTYVPYSSPTATAGSKKWHIFGYDNYNRVVSESNQYLNLSYSYYDYNNPSMHQYFVTIFDNIRNVQRTTKYDALGRITQSTDAGGSVNYSYSYQTISGKTRDKTTISVGGNTTTVISDIRGNRLSIQDPDAGTVTNTYNVLNQLTSRLDDNGCGTAYSYDLGGRTTQIVYSKGAESETITYTYDNAEGGGIGQLASVKKDGRSDCVYYYDDLGRLIRKKVYDGGSYYNHQYEYNSLGQLQYFTYPDSYRIENIYNSFGELKQINDASDNSLIYAVDSRNIFRRPTTCRYGNGTGVVYSYNAYGMLTGIKNGDVVEGVQPNGNDLVPEFGYTIDDQYRMLSYTYNDRGFIASRSDAKVNQTESYYYDNLDRLTSYKVNGTTAASYTYGNTGNMLTNSRVGAYSYGADKPHAVTGIAGNIACPISASQCDVTYNLRNKPSSIIENGNRIAIDYDAAGMRRHTWHYRNNVLNNTTAIISNVYELSSGTSRKLDYIYADGQPVAVHVKRGTADSLYYLMTDHLGSWNKVMDEDKNIVQQTHFDPWGNRMSYTAWNTPQTQISFPFSRGFTGHEHYDRFKIINANARLYDPVIGRFFSPDPFVQAPDFTQNYNRYSYCMNNPVMYSDPDGEIFGTVFGFLSDLIDNVFVRTFTGEKWDWTQTKNGWEIDKSIFHTDPNKTIGGRVWEVVSRFTWQLPQTIIGDLFVSVANAFGYVNYISHGYGVTAVDMGLKKGAVTIGYFTAGPEGYKANWRDHLFVHEYGHYVQSQQHGPLYLLTVGIPSLQSAILQTNNPDSPSHDIRWFEADASYKGAEYFDSNYGSGQNNFETGSIDYFERNSFVGGTPSSYLNPRTGLQNRSINPISGKFHWTDIPIYIPGIGLFPFLLYL